MAIAAVSLSVSVGGVAPPASAALLAPTDLAATSTPVLSWSSVAGATRYDVQVDDDSAFGSPEFVVKSTNLRSVPTKTLAGGTQYWRVRALDSSGASSDWSQSEFEQPPVDVPTSLTPDAVQLAQPSEPPVLAWTGIQGATSYTVELDTDDDFIGAQAVSTQTTSLVWPLPLEAGDYWWRVQATKAAGVVSQPSAAATFDVLPLDAVVQVSPEDSPDAEVEDVVLDWDPVPGAKFYELRVARDSDFNTIIDDVSPVFGTTYSPKVTYNNAQYYWQVRAVDLAGKPTAWTTVQNSFSRVWPDRPDALFPVGAVDSPGQFEGEPYFQWTPVQHASVYQIQMGTDATFSPGTYTECITAGTTYTASNTTATGASRGSETCVPFVGAVTYWRVRPLDYPFRSGAQTGVQGLYSETQAVIWTDQFITSMSPIDGELTDIPTLHWSGTRSAEKYKIEIRNSQNILVKTAETYATSYTPVGVGKLNPGVYSWTVMAEDAAKHKSLIHESSFSVSGVIPTTGADPLTSIGDTTPTLKAPELMWEPHPDAEYYKIRVGTASSGTYFLATSADVFDKKLPYPAVTDTSKRLLAPGDYIWFINAYDSTDTLIASSDVNTFTITGFPAVEGQSIALDGMTLDAGAGCSAHLDGDGVTGPQCDAVPATPTLSWDPIPGMSHYLVYVSNDASFTNLVEASIPASTGTRYAPTVANTEPTLPESQAGKSYFWFVRPCKAISQCGPNPISTTGMATNAFRKLSPAVVLETPEQDGNPAEPNVATGEVAFEWQDYFDTNAAATWAETGETAPQAAQNYRIQVDDSPTFATPLDTQVVDQSTYTAVDSMYPEGQLYWRVQALDGDGKSLTWSPVRSFVKRSPSSVLNFPINNEAVSGTAAFRWEPQAFNSAYRIEVYKNDDTTFSPANRVFFKDVTTTAYSWDQPLPASAAAFVWRVRGKDSDGNLLPWSQTGRFFSTGAAPSLLEPAADTQQLANGPLFTWTSVPGAAKYQIEVRTATTQFVKTTTTATAYATISTVPDGTLNWRITALDTRGNVMGNSEWRDFTVDASAPKVVSFAPMRSAKLGANFVAKFSEPVTNVNGQTMKLYLKGRQKKLAATVTLSVAGMTATLNPTANLVRGKVYTLKLSSGITDQSGNPLPAYKWQVTAQ